MRRLAPAAAVLAATSLALTPLAAADATTRNVASAHLAALKPGRPAVTLGALPASSQVGTRLTLKGKVARGTKVVIQRHYAGTGWTTVGTGVGSTRGTYAVKVPLTQGGTTTFRAVKGAARTAPASLKVFQWLDLDDQSQYSLNSGGLAFHIALPLNATTYPESYLAPSGGALVIVNTASLCTRAEVHSGFDASTTPDPADTMSFSGGDLSSTNPVTHETAVGHVDRIVVALTGVAQAGFAFAVNEGPGEQGSPDAVLASPRLFCNATALPQAQTGGPVVMRSAALGWLR